MLLDEVALSVCASIFFGAFFCLPSPSSELHKELPVKVQRKKLPQSVLKKKQYCSC